MRVRRVELSQRSPDAAFGAGVAAAVGSAAGGLIGAGTDFVEFDSRLAELADALQPDSSALMLWADPNDVEEFVAVFRAHDAKLVRSSLTDKQARRLKAALSGEGNDAASPRR